MVSWKIQLTPIQCFLRLISVPLADDCESQAETKEESQVLPSVINIMQEKPSEMAVVQISRTEDIMKFYHNMADQIPYRRILRSWNQSH